MKRPIIPFVIAGLLLSGCSSHRFIPTGMEQSVNDPKPPNCGARILLHAPDTTYSEIGICMAQVPGGGMISDKTPEAIQELQKCACLAGGDAVILSSSNEAGMIPAFGGYSQQVAKSRGIVIVFKK